MAGPRSHLFVGGLPPREELGEALAQEVPARQRVEDPAGMPVLSGDPLANRGIVGRLEPAVALDDASAVVLRRNRFPGGPGGWRSREHDGGECDGKSDHRLLLRCDGFSETHR